MFKNQKEWEEGFKYSVIYSRQNIKLTEVMGLEYVDSNFEEKSVTYRFSSKDYYENQFEGVQGAIPAAILEVACGVVANTIAGEKDSSLMDIHVSYINKLTMADEIIAKVYLVKAGRTIIRTRAEIYDKNSGKLAVSAVVCSFANQ